MPLPPSVTKIDKNGVTFTSNVDQAQYLLSELVRAANRDVGKYLVRKIRQATPAEHGRLRRKIGYWARKREGDLRVGINPAEKPGYNDVFYGGFLELGTQNYPKVGMITHTVESEISMIRQIQGQYLSAIADKNRALGLIDEDAKEEGEE